MKKLAYILAAAVLVFSCAKEEINHPFEGQVADASSFEPVITVDQEINQVTFTVDAKAVVPVWVFQDSEGSWTEYHSGNGYKKIYTKAGDYSVRMHVMNAAGMSPDYVQKTFHVNNTLVSFDKYYAIFAKGPWHIDGNTEAHMACGESVDNPTGWWKAPKNDKAAFGVYDNQLTFTAEGNYTFDPGTAGTVYVNIGVTAQPFVDAKGDATSDYTAPATVQQTKYKFDVDGENVVLALENGAFFPYIPNDDFVKDTRFIVKELSAKSITLVWYTPTGNGGGPIAWQFIISNTTGGDDNPGGGEQQGGYTYGPNLLEGLDLNSTWFSAADWSGALDPNASFTGGTLTLTVPDGIGGSEWQGQVKLVAPIPADPEKQYAFFANVESSTDGTFTVKVADAANDKEHAFFYDNGAKVAAFTPLAYKNEPIVPDQAYEGVMVIFDFGRMAEGTSITVTNIELKEITGGTPGGGGETAFDYNSDRNLWKPADAAHTYSQFYAPGWAQIASPAITNNGSSYSFSCPEATSEQWQNQFFVIPDAPIALSAEKLYDFQCKVELSQEVKQVTFKLTDMTDDGNFLFTERRNIAAYEEFVFELKGLAGIDAAAVKMVFDFGGNPANTDVTIKDIILQEHIGGVDPGPSASDMVYDDADNVWKAADAAHTYSQFYAPGWAQIASPAITNNGSSYSFSCPEATSEQWQNQFFIIPAAPIALTAAKTYDFQCKVELSQEVKQVTFKLTDTTDDGNFLFTERRNIASYEEFTFTLLDVAGIDAAAVKMVFDFGGNPANTDVTIKDIILREHK